MIITAFMLSMVGCGGKKLTCKSNEGNITISYNDKGIIGYTSKGITYDLEGQQEYAKIVGVDAYMEEFTNWFESATTGTCKQFQLSNPSNHKNNLSL